MVGCLYVHRHSNCMLIRVKAKERKQIINTEIYIFDPQYDGYLQAHKIQGIAMI
jgi:hypothetical protein